MRKGYKKVIIIIVILTLLISIPSTYIISANNYATSSLNTRLNNRIADIDLASRWITYEEKDIYLNINLSEVIISPNSEIERVPEGLKVGANANLTINFSIPKTDVYSIFIEYLPVSHNIFENTVIAKINHEEYRCSLPFIWNDKLGDIKSDKYGNQLVPEQVMVESYSANYIEDYNSFQRTPISFNLSAGENTLSLTPENQDILFVSIKILKVQSESSYAVFASNQPQETVGNDFIIIEGEAYRAKSDSFIRGRSVNNSGVVPNDPYVKLINATDDKSNKAIGQKILYEFEVVTPGLYSFAFKYCQPLKAGMPVFRTIEIDGQVPFSELRDVKFNHTGLDKYENIIMGGERPYRVWLDKGVHTLAIKTTAEPIDGIYKRLIHLISSMNSTTLAIKKIKGNNADVTANVDKNRTWDIFQYVPNIIADIEKWQDELRSIYEELKEISGTEPSFSSDIMLAVENLERLKKEPSKIPNRLSLLSDESSSAAQLIGTLLPKLYEQNLSIDRIYVYGNNALPSPRSSFMNDIIKGAIAFFYSFSDAMNNTEATNNTKLNVWINKPTQFVEVLQELTANDFTQKYGIDVIFSIMPNEQKIILANSSNTNPDVGLGLSYYLPFDFALRGIAKNLLDYGDFITWYSEQYNIESLTPMSYDGGVYGASETQDFLVLFYRKDILEMLDIGVPQTMDDVRKMMPKLHRNAMNFNLPLANSVGYKNFTLTLPYIYQNNGDFYSEDSLSVGLDNPNTLKGMSEMVDLYRIYGMSQNIPNFFNSFRSGSVPIGVSNFATYLQLKLTAPEMAGLWDIALTPGTLQPNGTISRYQAADTTSAMIFQNSNKQEEAYKFLKWWLSMETQIKYSNDMQLKFGPDFIWNTANHEAFKQMQYSQEHKDIILEQWAWQKEVPRHPASYIIEREISNSWIDIVTKGKPFQPTIDKISINCNREMQRKLSEFGYYDEMGNLIRHYKIDTIETFKEETATSQEEMEK